MGTRDFRAQSKDTLLPRDLLPRHSLLNGQPVSLPQKRQEPTVTNTRKPLGAVIMSSILARNLPQPYLTTEPLQNERQEKGQQESIHSLTA